MERYRLRDEVADIVDEWNRLGAALYENEVRLRPGAERTCARSGRRGYAWGSPPPNDPHVLGAMRHVDVGGALRHSRALRTRGRARQRTTPTSTSRRARRLGAEPADCAVFEDILPGTLSAARAGMATVAVESSDPRQPAAELRRAADRWIAGWEGLLG